MVAFRPLPELSVAVVPDPSLSAYDAFGLAAASVLAYVQFAALAGNAAGIAIANVPPSIADTASAPARCPQRRLAIGRRARRARPNEKRRSPLPDIMSPCSSPTGHATTAPAVGQPILSPRTGRRARA